MSERKWTDDQRDAIYAKWINEEKNKRGNILVQAAAGSGKTAVLVERIIKKLTSDNPEDLCDVSNLLVVTFTNAAAGEMRERISAALSKELTKAIENKDIKKQRYLKNQISRIGNADITTIDAFCLKTIRSYFHILNIDPDFSIVDSSEMGIMKDDAMEMLFEQMYEENNSDFLDLVCCYTDGRDDRKVSDMIKMVYNFIQSFPEPEEWLRKKCGMFFYPENSVWVKESERRAKSYIKSGINSLKSAAEILVKEALGYCDNLEETMKRMPPCEENDIYLAWGSYYTAVYNEYFAMKDMLSKSWDEVYELLQMEYIKINAKAVYEDKDKQIDDKELKEIIKGLRNEAKDMCGCAAEYISMPFEEMCSIIKKTGGIVKALFGMTERFGKIYSEMKAEQNVMEFSDVEHMCFRLFRDYEEVRNEFKERYQEILMDEYQDSNRLQDELFKMISRGDNIFMVGDIKQSIYLFRSSDPTIFKEKSDIYIKEETAENRKIVLGKNFRSRGQVLESINDLFELIMTEDSGGIDYDEDHRLNTGDTSYENVNGDYRSECIVIESVGEDDDESFEEARLEARVIAKRIRELKEEGFKVRDVENVSYHDPKTGEVVTKSQTVYRDLKNKDITILMSSHKNVANIYVEELAKAGVDCYAESKGYFERNEVKLVIALLKIIGNPYQDIPLLGVLRSPIGGFSDDDLVNIRLSDEGYIYSAMRSLSESYRRGEVEDESAKKTAVKAIGFMEKLSRWREYVNYMSSDKLIWTLYEETDIYGFVGALYGGEDAQANLRLLFERAKKYENSGYKGLFNFVRYICLLKKKEEDLSAASMVTENHDVVRVMTLHKSKGLEFPVVFMAGCGKRFFTVDYKSSLFLHKDYGIGLDYIDFENGIKIPNLTKKIVVDVLKDECVSEEIRKLYVALTRAKEKLIVTATVKPPKDGIESLEEKCREEAEMSASAVLGKSHFIDWVMPVAINNPEKWLYKHVSYIEAVSGIEEIETKDNEIADSGKDISWFMKYEYPYKGISDIPSKVSVSQIKQKKDENEFHTAMIPVPEFMKPKERIKGAKRGTVIHYIMQKIPFSENMDEQYVDNFKIKLQNDGLLIKEEVDAVDSSSIAEFYNSPLGMRMRKSNNIYRETAFETEIPANMVDEEYPGDEKVILQGIIDCYFEEDDGLVLVDYKSDYYENIEEMKKKYTMQLELYGDAIEKITEKKVKSKYLYLFFGDDVVEL